MTENVIYFTLKSPPVVPAHVEISGGIQNGPVRTEGAGGVSYDFTNAGKQTYQVALVYSDGGVEFIHIDARYAEAFVYADITANDYRVPVIDLVAASGGRST